MWIHDICGHSKVVVGMVHLDALPGTPRYLPEVGLREIVAHAKEDYTNLVDEGIDAVIFCNENDKPYSKHVSPNIVAAMTAIIREVTDGKSAVPFGVDIQWDSLAALAVAQATGASFVRGIICGSYCGDLGLFTPDTEKILKFRNGIGADHVKLITNLSPEFSSRLDSRPIELVAKTAVKSALVDGLCVSGAMAGTSASYGDLAVVKNAVCDVPIFANTGVTADNIETILETADACIVATCLKKDCQAANRIDKTSVEKLMSIVRRKFH